MLERTSTHLPARPPLTPLGGLLALLVAPGASATPLDPLGFGLIQSSWDPSGAITIDTDALTLSEGGLVLTGELSPDGIAVFTFGEVVIDEIVTVTGARPVAILSRGDLVLDAEIVAGAWWRAPGPGGHPGGASQGASGSGPGGGVGNNSGAGGGGFGGGGGASSLGAPGGSSYGDLRAQLEGGSGGGRSGWTSVGGDGGGGGGAVELGAVGRLDVTSSGVIDVTGYPGWYGWGSDGGGGGAGGGILLHGGGGTCEGQLDVRGGSGGESCLVFWCGIGGGGGGGGHVVIDGLSVNNCAIQIGGGDGGDGTGDDGEDGRIDVILDLDGDGDGWTVGQGDCNDTNAAIHPGRAESLCNGNDDDCDPLTPDEPDVDSDGFDVCSGDCDDTDPAVYPGGPEIACNNIDDDCDPLTPDEPDADGDGFDVCSGDCDDTDPLIAAGLPETLCDGLDNDCDPGTPDDVDNDGDGSYFCVDDCDDLDPSIHPGATDTPGDGIDQDCSGADAQPEGTPTDTSVDDTGAPLPPTTSMPTRRSNTLIREPSGCGCQGIPGGSGALWGLGGLSLLLIRRRRR